MVEPWLRGTRVEIDALRRQVLHALDQAGEDVARWCEGLSDEQMEAQPFALASAGFHLRHIARSLDRLLTYAEGRALTADQRESLAAEEAQRSSAAAMLHEFRIALADAAERILRFDPKVYDEPRFVGRDRLPTSLGGLLVHVAEHTQRHVGQAISAAQLAVRVQQQGSTHPGSISA